MTAPRTDRFVVGTRFKMSELGIIQFPELTHKTGTVIEVSTRTTGLTVLFEWCRKTDRPRPNLYSSFLRVAVSDRAPSFSDFRSEPTIPIPVRTRSVGQRRLQPVNFPQVPQHENTKAKRMDRPGGAIVQAGPARAGVSKIAAGLGRHAGSVRRMTRTMGILLNK